MFWNTYTTLCAKQGASPNAVAKSLSIASGTVTKWKNGAMPQNATLKKLADYFGVPVNYFDEEKEQAPLPALNLSSEEVLLLQQWRNHPTAQPFVRKLLDMPEPQSEDGAVS